MKLTGIISSQLVPNRSAGIAVYNTLHKLQSTKVCRYHQHLEQGSTIIKIYKTFTNTKIKIVGIGI